MALGLVLHNTSANKVFVLPVDIDFNVDLNNITTIGGFVGSFVTVCRCSSSRSCGNNLVRVGVDLHWVVVVHVELHWVECGIGQRQQP